MGFVKYKQQKLEVKERKKTFVNNFIVILPAVFTVKYP